MRLRKLGFSFWDQEASELSEQLLSLLEASKADWTLAWRRLASVAERWDELIDSDLLGPLRGCLAAPVSGRFRLVLGGF